MPRKPTHQYDIEAICRKIENGVTIPKIAEEMGISRQVLGSYVQRNIVVESRITATPKKSKS